MTTFQPTHVHKVTGEQFQFVYVCADGDLTIYDKNGECRAFLPDMLTPIQPVEEWEPVPGQCLSAGADGVLIVWLKDHSRAVLPHPNVRLVDGCRLERRTR